MHCTVFSKKYAGVQFLTWPSSRSSHRTQKALQKTYHGTTMVFWTCTVMVAPNFTVLFYMYILYK